MASQNSGEFVSTDLTTDFVCGCAGEITGSDIRDHPFEVQSRGGREPVGLRRVPHEGEVQLVRGIVGVAAGAAMGGFIVLSPAVLDWGPRWLLPWRAGRLQWHPCPRRAPVSGPSTIWGRHPLFRTLPFASHRVSDRRQSLG